MKKKRKKVKKKERKKGQRVRRLCNLPEFRRTIEARLCVAGP